MRIKKYRPWLTSMEVEIPTEELIEICKSWDTPTWAAYLAWYESSCRERLVSSGAYTKLCDELTASIFVSLGHDTDPEKTDFCQRLLKSLPKFEAYVLAHIFLHGLTERQVAAKLKISKTRAHEIKFRALSRLRRGIQGNDPTTRQLVKGMNSNSHQTEFSIWEIIPSSLIREARMYDPNNHVEELKNIERYSLKRALSELSERQQHIIYLRFWCDYSFNEIARELGCGINVAEQICDATIFKLKTKIIARETGKIPGGDQPCV